MTLGSMENTTMTHNATMDLAEKMGSEATEADAQRMAVILRAMVTALKMYREAYQAHAKAEREATKGVS